MNPTFQTENFQPVNRAFLNGDAVKCYFFVRNSKLIMAEECYFFLMASMRKMRMNIPLSYTLEYFQNLLHNEILNRGFSNGIITFMAFRTNNEKQLQKSETDFYIDSLPLDDVLEIQKNVEIDVIKEISVNNGLLSNIQVHCAENTYSQIYAQENDLDDVILLNPDKRIARCSTGNLLLLTGKKIRIPKQTEGAYISPLMENFVTYLHKNHLAEISEEELIPFETQKADEILLISDRLGIFSVSKIRNKSFGSEKFTGFVAGWKKSLEEDVTH